MPFISGSDQTIVTYLGNHVLYCLLVMMRYHQGSQQVLLQLRYTLLRLCPGFALPLIMLL